MQYQLENLGPEKFQELCQSLLIKERPSIQCFPVGQPDGGRDAIAYFDEGAGGEFVVYQVKYSRRPSAIKDPLEWIDRAVTKELHKVEALAEHGAREYCLITNLSGTAHLDVGLIDKVNRLLAEKLPVAAQCWWREDISRRLDDAFDLKWVYPEIMSGPDALRMIIEGGRSEDARRRALVIQSFVVAQYQADNKIRFKQVDLQNNLLDLFVDVPAILRPTERSGRIRPRDLAALRNIALDEQAVIGVDAAADLSPYDAGQFGDYGMYDLPVGAATMLLHAATQRDMRFVILEGAPGQGKSTLGQYVAQVHRMHFLGRHEDIALLPAHHRSQPARLPIRVDLRDLATWMRRQNPFGSPTGPEPPSAWHRSLESFLAALISHESGGNSFSVSDLQDVVSRSAVLLVLDGLDEVADISERRDLVGEVQGALHRLDHVAASLQVVVTTRPAAFANTPGFPETTFRYSELTLLPRHLIRAYSDKWVVARRLTERESAEVTATLDARLEEPHLRDLARNPMQLAILLNLIYIRGASLPDKRTSLYDNYVDVFFNRESEKDHVVREHRDLLIDIHRFLGWKLHSEAELGRTRGSITQEDLQDTLTEYLTRRGHETRLVDDLFRGVVERVVALVSRVEGTFEFEVQPLREYFAARYLYETTPYSPPGAEQKGTLLQRFSALARNPYWLNVTRFYAGCYSVGQLPSLIFELEALFADVDYKHTSQPRVLTSLLLSDWVFSQHPKAIEKAIELALQDFGTRHAFTGVGRPGRVPTLSVPHKSGRERLADKALAWLDSVASLDRVNDVLRTLRANVAVNDLVDGWRMRTYTAVGDKRTQWIGWGARLGLLSDLALNEIDELMEDDPYDPRRLASVLQAGHFDYVEENESRMGALATALLDKSIVLLGEGSSSSSAYVLRDALGFVEARRWRYPDWSEIPFLHYTGDSKSETATKVQELAESVMEFADSHPNVWRRSLAPWNAAVESLRRLWGDVRVAHELAVGAAGIPTSPPRDLGAAAWSDHSIPLCTRARAVRLRAGVRSFWSRALRDTQDPSAREFALAMFFTWAGPTSLAANTSLADSALSEGNHAQYASIIRCIRSVRTQWPNSSRPIFIDPRALPKQLAPRTVAVLCQRVTGSVRKKLTTRYLSAYEGQDVHIWRLRLDNTIARLRSNSSTWATYLELARQCYEATGTGITLTTAWTRDIVQESMPARTAHEVIDNAGSYPWDIVLAAEARCTHEAAGRARPVGHVARQERWFDA